jgi:adenosylcobinamide kinase / adenosylcobinamide-phosphate guanylyltransferase
MADVIFVTGPVRSGKSRCALERALAWGDAVAFVATYRNAGDDSEMEQRLARHRAERPSTWRTLEAPGDISDALWKLDPSPSGVILDCLTLWLADRLGEGDEVILESWKAQLDAFRKAPWPLIIVGNEVGWSLVPDSAELRRFRDLAGWLAQATAAASEEVWLCVAGCPMRLK